MSDFEFMEYYVHIMLVGANDGHVYTAIQDQAFKPIRRIYLIHSPNQKKSSSIKKPILFKKVAQKLKTEIEKHNPAKVILKQLTENGPFDKLETITEITKIVNAEMETLATQKQIAINITGGTNMMAVGAILAAFSKQTEAYYVIDTRYPENQKLKSKLSKIGIPNPRDNSTLDDDEKNILYEIANNKFTWAGTSTDATLNEELDEESTIPRQSEIRSRIDSSIDGTEWMEAQSKPGVIEQRTLTSIFDTTKKSEHPSYKKYKKKNKLLHPNTLRRKLSKLESKGMIQVRKGIPSFKIERSQSTYRYKNYRINEKENLIEIMDQGKAEIITHTP